METTKNILAFTIFVLVVILMSMSFGYLLGAEIHWKCVAAWVIGKKIATIIVNAVSTKTN